MTGVDVYCLWGIGGGTSGRRWYRASGLVDQTGNVDTVVGEGIIGICVVSFHLTCVSCRKSAKSSMGDSRCQRAFLQRMRVAVCSLLNSCAQHENRATIRSALGEIVDGSVEEVASKVAWAVAVLEMLGKSAWNMLVI